jgi:AbiV family abortive infection protein
LLDRGRWARAGALSVLAVEESGKAHLCHMWAFHVLPTIADRSEPAAWAESWEAFTDHPEKFDRWLSRVDGLGACSDFGAWKQDATTAHLSKLACLYIDWILPGGKVTTPQIVTEEDARQFVHIARDAITYWEQAGWGADQGEGA